MKKKMMTGKTKMAVVCVAILVVGRLVPTGQALAAPVIKDWSSSGGRTQNKTGAKDRMYLVKAGDKITFSVSAEGAKKYEWQVNKKKQDKATGNSLTWTAPNEKGIWEIHLKITGGNKEAHQEWVVSTLSKKESPDFFDYFTDMKCDNRTEKDPWDRKLPEWRVHAAAGDVSKGFIGGASFRRDADSDAAYGTWKFRFRFPNGYMLTPGGTTEVHYYYIMGGGEAFDYSVGADGHHHAFYYHHGSQRTCMHMDAGWGVNKEWRQATMIRTPDGYFYTYLDGVLESRWPEPVGTTCIKVRMRKSGTFGNPDNLLYVDGLEIYKNRYFFPDKSARYEQYITNWAYNGKGSWHGGNWCPIYDPVKKTGVVIRGRGVRLKDVADALKKPSLFAYDSKTKTAVCRTNLVVADAAELILDGETLKIYSPSPGKNEFAVMYGATLRVKGSTITSGDDNYFTWRFTSTTHFGYPAGMILGPLRDPAGYGSPAIGALTYRGLHTVVIENSTVNNSAYMFLDAAHEIRITDTKITNLHEVDAGEYSSHERKTKRRKEFVRGKKGLWVFYKNGDLFDFTMRNVTLSGKNHPLNIVFMLDNSGEMLNVYDLDVKDENIEVRHSCEMGSFWYNNTKHYDSTLGIVNCRFADLVVPTEWAWAVPKYYLDVKVVDANGAPVSGATVSVANEVDDTNYPSENMVSRRIYTYKNRDKLRGQYRFFSYTPLRSVTTGADGHTTLPSDPKHTLVIADYVKAKDSRKKFTYTITVEKDGKKKVVKGVNPGPKWYRPDPNKPTHTITLVLDEEKGS